MGRLRCLLALVALGGLTVAAAASRHGGGRKTLQFEYESPDVPEQPKLPLMAPMVPSQLTQDQQYEDRVVTIKQLVDKPIVVKETVVVQKPKVVWVDETGRQVDTSTDDQGRPRRTKVVMQTALREQSRVEMGKEVVERTVVIKEPISMRPWRPQPPSHRYFPDPSLDASLKDGGYFVNSMADPSPLAKPPVSDAEISECLRVLKALQLPLEGHTLLCPSNLGMARTAWAAGFRSVGALLAAAVPGSKALSVVKRVMRAHVVEGLWPRASLVSGAHRTLLTFIEPSAVVSFEVDDRGDVRVDGGAGERRRVVAADLGPSGLPYRAGSDAFVVHVIDAPALPPGTPFFVDDSVAAGGPGPGARPVADLIRCWNEGDGDGAPGDDAVDAQGNPAPWRDDGMDDVDEWGCKRYKRYAPARLSPGTYVNPVIGKESIGEAIFGDPSAPSTPARVTQQEALADNLALVNRGLGPLVPGARRRV